MRLKKTTKIDLPWNNMARVHLMLRYSIHPKIHVLIFYERCICAWQDNILFYLYYVIKVVVKESSSRYCCSMYIGCPIYKHENKTQNCRKAFSIIELIILDFKIFIFTLLKIDTDNIGVIHRHYQLKILLIAVLQNSLLHVYNQDISLSNITCKVLFTLSVCVCVCVSVKFCIESWLTQRMVWSHSLRVRQRHHWLNTKRDADVDAKALAHATCKLALTSYCEK